MHTYFKERGFSSTVMEIDVLPNDPEIPECIAIRLRDSVHPSISILLYEDDVQELITFLQEYALSSHDSA